MVKNENFVGFCSRMGIYKVMKSQSVCMNASQFSFWTLIGSAVNPSSNKTKCFSRIILY